MDVRMTAEQHKRLKSLAKSWGVSMQQIMIWAFCEAVGVLLLLAVATPQAMAIEESTILHGSLPNSTTFSQPLTVDKDGYIKVITTGKQRFSDKHPRLYKIARKTRTVCVFISPSVNVAANLIITAVMQFAR